MRMSGKGEEVHTGYGLLRPCSSSSSSSSSSLTSRTVDSGTPMSSSGIANPIGQVPSRSQPPRSILIYTYTEGMRCKVRSHTLFGLRRKEWRTTMGSGNGYFNLSPCDRLFQTALTPLFHIASSSSAKGGAMTSHNFATVLLVFRVPFLGGSAIPGKMEHTLGPCDDWEFDAGCIGRPAIQAVRRRFQ